MKTVNIYEAKTTLSKLIEQVSRGEQIVIAKNGKPVAHLGPYVAPSNIKLGLWQGRHDISYQDADIIGSDPSVTKGFNFSEVMPGDSK